MRASIPLALAAAIAVAGLAPSGWAAPWKLASATAAGETLCRASLTGVAGLRTVTVGFVAAGDRLGMVFPDGARPLPPVAMTIDGRAQAAPEISEDGRASIMFDEATISALRAGHLLTIGLGSLGEGRFPLTGSPEGISDLRLCAQDAGDPRPARTVAGARSRPGRDALRDGRFVGVGDGAGANAGRSAPELRGPEPPIPPLPPPGVLVLTPGGFVFSCTATGSAGC